MQLEGANQLLPLFQLLRRLWCSYILRLENILNTFQPTMTECRPTSYYCEAKVCSGEPNAQYNTETQTYSSHMQTIARFHIQKLPLTHRVSATAGMVLHKCSIVLLQNVQSKHCFDCKNLCGSFIVKKGIDAFLKFFENNPAVMQVSTQQAWPRG